MKKLLAVLLAAGLSASAVLLSGCGGSNRDPEVLRVTFMAKHEYTNDLEELGFIDEIEEAFLEKTGMTISWKIIPVGDEETKGLQLTSERNIPDVFIGESYSDSVIMQNKDLFVPLNDYINDERLPNVNRMFKEILEQDGVDFWKEAALADGELYGIPRVAPFASTNVNFYMVNAVWIRAINEYLTAQGRTSELLTDPTPTEENGVLVYPDVTIADFDGWVRAFHDEELYTNAIYNKTYSWYENGEKVITSVPYSQSIALDMNGESDLYNYLTAFGDSEFGTKGQNDGLLGNVDNLYVRTDASGEIGISYKYTNEEIYHLAEYFHDLYADGVLNNEFITQSFTTMMGNSRNATGSKVGCASGWSLQDKYGVNADQYVAFKPLKGDESFQQYQALNMNPTLSNTGYGLKYAYNRYLITDLCRRDGKLEAALDLLEIFYDPVMSMKTFLGSGSESFHEYTGTEVNPDTGEVYKYEFQVPDGEFYDVWKWKNGFADNGLGYCSAEICAQTLMDEEHLSRVQLSEEVYAPYNVEEGEYVPLNMKFTEEEQVFLDEYFSYYNTLGSTAVSQYITGTNTSSDWWSTLQSNLERYGVADLEALYLRKYNEYFAD